VKGGRLLLAWGYDLAWKIENYLGPFLELFFYLPIKNAASSTGGTFRGVFTAISMVDAVVVKWLPQPKSMCDGYAISVTGVVA
jgi:hypothetical protein